MSGPRKSKKPSHLGRPRKTTRKRSNATITSQFLQPSRLFMNGNILTMDPARPTTEVIAVSNDKIIAVGTNLKIRRLAGPATHVTDL